MRRPSRFSTAVLVLLLAGCATGRDTPLTEAAAAGDRPAVVRLLAAGADPNGLDGSGTSPLIHAVREGHVRLIGILIDRGADPDLPDRGRGWPPVQHAVHMKNMDAVRALLNAGADPNARSAGGGTPLMMAAGYGFSRITRLLLERGADPRLESPSGGVALGNAMVGAFGLDHVTVGDCQTDTVRVLVKAAPDVRPAEGSWALRLARWKRCHEIVRMLERAGGRGPGAGDPDQPPPASANGRSR